MTKSLPSCHSENQDEGKTPQSTAEMRQGNGRNEMARYKKVRGAEMGGQKDRLLCALSSGPISFSAYITITKSTPRITLKTEKKLSE